MAGREEELGQAEHRAAMLEGVTGRVVDLGAGNGLNFRHYPRTVTELVAVEPEPYLRARAEEAAQAAAIPIRVVDGLGGELPFPDGSFDAAVVSLVLCSVPDQATVLRDLRRILKPGGELRFYEHVRAGSPRLARVQDAIAPVWPCFGGGCHPNRDTAAAIARAGFDIERCERFRFRPSVLCAPVAPRILGVARR